jgi:hypothetical protein
MAEIAGLLALLAVIGAAVIGYLGWSWLHLLWLAPLGVLLYFQVRPAVWRHVERDGMASVLPMLIVTQAVTFAFFIGAGRLIAWAVN